MNADNLDHKYAILMGLTGLLRFLKEEQSHKRKGTNLAKTHIMPESNMLNFSNDSRLGDFSGMLQVKHLRDPSYRQHFNREH